MTTIVLLCDEEDISVLISTEQYKTGSLDDALFIATNGLALEMLSRKGIAAIGIDQFYTFEEHASCESLALELAETWYKGEKGNDFSEYNGFSLGWILKRFVQHYFDYLLRVINNCINLLESERPKKVVGVAQRALVAELNGSQGLDLYKEVFNSLSLKYGFSLEWITNQNKFSSEQRKLGNLRYKALQRVKQLIVSCIDRTKNLISLIFPGHDTLKILMCSLTDIHYLKPHFIKTLLRAKDRIWIYYTRQEMNFFPHPRIIHKLMDGSISTAGREKLEGMNAFLEAIRKKTLNHLRTHPMFYFKGVA